MDGRNQIPSPDPGPTKARVPFSESGPESVSPPRARRRRAPPANGCLKFGANINGCMRITVSIELV